ncbi:hypothetical protein BJ508DRAFT_342788 [Ascobolus immersus RN42]|uniref:Uncharacterized protein n=1 Tax=Ascobolus immersus RN42 TaxID=1160509 RepID=A0A3N4HF25_ASCIM|nr:hypothetical protein BJ508DRAFT_342788 [Ascobolus immersus RN42]
MSRRNSQPRNSQSRINPRSQPLRRTNSQAPKKRQRANDSESGTSSDELEAPSNSTFKSRNNTTRTSNGTSRDAPPNTPTRASTSSDQDGTADSSPHSSIRSSPSSAFASSLRRSGSSWLLPSLEDKHLRPPATVVGATVLGNPLRQDPDTAPIPSMSEPGIWNERAKGAFPEPVPELLPFSSIPRHSLRRSQTLGQFLSQQSGGIRPPTIQDSSFDVTELLRSLNDQDQANHRHGQNLSSDSESDGEAPVEPPLVRHAGLRDDSDDDEQEAQPEGHESAAATDTDMDDSDKEKRRKKRDRKQQIEEGTFIPEVFLHDKAGNPELAEELTKTVIAMFVWSQDHNISLSAFNGLVEVIQKEWFRPEEVPKSYTTMKALRRHLPLLPIRSADVPVMDKKDVIESQLKNPQVVQSLHRGLGVESDKAIESQHGLAYKESIKSSIEGYPVRPKPASDAMVYPGSCLMVSLKNGRIPVRVTGVFRNERTMDCALFPQYKRKKWVTVNPILIRESDQRYFRVNPLPNDKNEPLDFDFTQDVTFEGKNGSQSSKDVRGILLLQNYRLPVSCLEEQVQVNIYRDSSEDGKFRSYLSADIVQKDKSDAVNHVREMIVPEVGSTPDPLRLLELWKEHDDSTKPQRLARELNAGGVPQPNRRQGTKPKTFGNTDKDGFAVPSTPASQLPNDNPEDIAKKRYAKQRRLERTRNKIRFSELVSTRHLRKTVAEDEIEKGEISLDEIFFDRDPPPPTNPSNVRSTVNTTATGERDPGAEEDPDMESRMDIDDDDRPDNPNPPSQAATHDGTDRAELERMGTTPGQYTPMNGTYHANHQVQEEQQGPDRSRKKRKKICISIDFYIT